MATRIVVLTLLMVSVIVDKSNSCSKTPDTVSSTTTTTIGIAQAFTVPMPSFSSVKRNDRIGSSSFSESRASRSDTKIFLTGSNDSSDDDGNSGSGKSNGGNSGSSGSSNGDSDIEAARRMFEAMMNGGGSSGQMSESLSDGPAIHQGGEKQSWWDLIAEASEAAPPPMTSIGRERKISELHLLAGLAHTDEDVERIWSIWHNERGPLAAQELYNVQDLIENRQFDQAEDRLRELISQHGTHWPEPINALATLKFMKGDMEESKRLCEAVLQVKPWHFGALSGIVMVCAALEDVPGARAWAARRLPPIQPTGANRRRYEWVERALRDCRDQLLQEEQRVEEYYGEAEEPRQVNQDDNDTDHRAGPCMDEDAWQ